VPNIRSTIQKRDAKGQIRHGGEWLAIWSDPDSLKSDAERREAAALDQATENTRAKLAASARSMSGNPTLEVSFLPGPESAHRMTLSPLETDGTDLPAARGEADRKASFRRYHDTDLHKKFRPSDQDTARLFDLLEQARCEGCSARALVGVADNLISFHLARMKSANLMNAHLAALIPLSEGLNMVLRDTFSGAAAPSVQTGGMRMWDRWMRDKFSNFLDELSSYVSEQTAYAAVALRFLDALFDELPSKGRSKTRRTPSALEPSDAESDAILRDLEDPAQAELFEPGDETDDDALNEDRLFATVPPAPYHVYSTRHDRIVKAQDLADQAELTRERRKLDEKQAEYRQEVVRLTARLQRRLLAQQARRWEFDMDEGLIDASRLDRVVLTPGFTNAYKQEVQSPFRDTLVTILIDNSGSMRGKSIETACVVADILAAALERCSIATEILGFTTRGWKGGQSAKDWKHAGKPANPGRLNDLLHVIYKDADTPLRRARDSICAMLSPSLLKENIDGEALLWAAIRALHRPEGRKLMIVISDGAPVDQATLDANEDKRILDQHLRETIAWVTNNTAIDLAAIGIRHDVAPCYPNAVQIDQAAGLGAAVIDLIDNRLSR